MGAIVVLLAAAAACAGVGLAEESPAGQAASSAVDQVSASTSLFDVPATSFQTAIDDDTVLTGPDAHLALQRMRASGATVVRLVVSWDHIAPGAKPKGFVGSDPASPGYDWKVTDGLVREVVGAGLQPLLTVTGAPVWAAPTPHNRPQDGPTKPSAPDFAQFATAIAKRYSGTYRGLPRVRYWEAWNEPNVSIYLMPQIDGPNAISPGTYRGLLNAFYTAVHRVHSDNVVAAGGLSPFTVSNGAVETVGPLAFLRDLLCLSAGRNPHATCSDVVRFDAWSVHPYTSGGPTHHATNPNDLSLGDLGKVRPLLEQAAELGHLQSSEPIQYWVTEFSWDTNPPDKNAVPIAVQARWTSDALYRMWQNGVDLATWFTLRDNPVNASDIQSGLYFRAKTLRADRAKPTLRAFRFPFVVHPSGRKILYWGHTTPGTKVTIERQAGERWARVRTLVTAGDGVFTGFLPANGEMFRATTTKDQSLPFAVKGINDLQVTPFGVGTIK